MDDPMTTEQKCEALVFSGLADDMDDALAQLVDMGEADDEDDE